MIRLTIVMMDALGKAGSLPLGAAALAAQPKAAALELAQLAEAQLAGQIGQMQGHLDNPPEAKDTTEVAVEAAPESTGEPEEDSAEDGRKRNKEDIGFDVPDTTINVMNSSHGGILMPMNEGGLQYLLAGARANVGIKAGRYVFEARVVELVNQVEAFGAQSRAPTPRYLMRLGFSVAGSMPILGDTEESVCFDSEGNFSFNKKRLPISSKFSLDCTIAIVLNLNETGPNANTISIYKDGVRMCAPQPVPQALQGKTLYPTVTFKNMTVHMNFGPELLEPLPFKARMLGDAAQVDTQLSPYKKPKDGKYEVLIPVCIPDQGTFDWLEWFLEDHPYYTEISDRKVIEWAVRSGFWRPKNPTAKASNDKPDMNLGVPQLDDGSVKFLLTLAASIQERDLVIMEVKGNFVAKDRQEGLKPFQLPHHNKVGRVMIGAPTGPYKEYVHAKMLKEKQAVADAEFANKKQERERAKLIKERQRQLEREKKKIELRRKKEEAEKKREAAAAAGEDVEVEKEEEEEDAEMEEAPEAEADEEPPQVELTAEEKADYFRKTSLTPDIATSVLATCFPSFAVPNKEEDGLDELHFDWKPRAESEALLKQWAVERRMTNRIENMTPSEWFKERWSDWQKDLQTWHMKHMEFKDPTKRAALVAASKKTGKKEDEEPPAKKQKGEEKKDEKKKQDEKKKDKKEDKDEEKDDEKKDEKKEDEKDPMALLAEELEQSELDVFGCEDICDILSGEPLFANFAFEDWALLSLRFEMHLLVHAFKRDCGDPERTGFPPEHLQFYFQRYYKKALNPKNYGAEKVEELIRMVGDTVVVCARVIESQLAPELEGNGIFVMLTEEARRERQERIDGGDESAKLKFSSRASENTSPAAAVAAAQAKAAMQANTASGMLWPSRPKQQIGPRTPMVNTGAPGGTHPGPNFGGPRGQWGGGGMRGPNPMQRAMMGRGAGWGASAAAGPYGGGFGGGGGGWRPYR